MDGEQAGYPGQYVEDSNAQVKDLEEKQRILKDRLLLIGQNLIETKEETQQKLLEIKKDIMVLKENMEKTISFLEMASSEFSKFAKKEDLELLSKQAKMFQPLNLSKKKD